MQNHPISPLRMKLILCFGCILFGHSLAWSQNESQTVRPNILLIIADDLGREDVGAYGSKQAATPNLDRLAKGGACFDNMFTGEAICAPSRQQILTGMYPVRNGAFPNHSSVYDGVNSLVHHLQPLGYRSGLWGKTHIGPKSAYPFEYLPTVHKSKTLDDLQPVENFIRQNKQQPNAARPFFLVVASDEPHGPHDMGIAARYQSMAVKVPPYLVDTEETRRYLKEYYTEVEFFDRQVGRCLDALDREGLTKNTIVIFLSDNGTAYFGKWTCYDVGLRMPFIIRYPEKIKSGSRIKALTEFVDIAPTLIELAGGDPNTVKTGRPDTKGHGGFDGKSFAKLFPGKAGVFKSHVYAINTTRGIINGNDCYPIRMVRDTRYAYIRNLNHTVTYSNVAVKSPVFTSWLDSPNAAAVNRAKAYLHRPEEELYDIQNDPYQLHNLAANPRFSGIKKDLRTRLDAFMDQQGDRAITTEMEALTRQMKGREN